MDQAEDNTQKAFDAAELSRMCAVAVGKPLQTHLRRLGLPNEQYPPGRLMNELLVRVSHLARLADTPTGFTVEPEIALTFECFRQLEKELGRILCNSGDVIFGSIQIGAFDFGELLNGGECDCRDVGAVSSNAV